MTLILLQNVAVRCDQALVLRDVYFRLAAGAAAGLPPKAQRFEQPGGEQMSLPSPEVPRSLCNIPRWGIYEGLRHRC